MRKEFMRPQVSCQATASGGKSFRRYLCAGLSQPHPRFGHPRRRPRLLKGFVVARASCAWDPTGETPVPLENFVGDFARDLPPLAGNERIEL